jgi:sulfate/thiosulfate-binding protein
MNRLAKTLLTAAFAFGAGLASAKDITLLNVSYDPTREFYSEVNAEFAAAWKAKTGDTLTVQASHGGSGKQARSVIDGLEADVVTLALAFDIDAIADKARLLPPDWQTRLPHNSAPYTSTIVFLVRKGNPKGIHDWGDLVKDGVEVITPNPKTSGGARWNYLAAWGYALKQPGGDEARAQQFVAQLYQHVPVLDTGARGSTTTFVQRGIGDVLLAWENEALLAIKELGADQVELVDKVVDEKGTRKQAEAYLNYLYSPQGQELAAQNFYRPTDPKVAAVHEKDFPKVATFTIGEVFGSWKDAQQKHFNDGGVFDQIYKPGN